MPPISQPKSSDRIIDWRPLKYREELFFRYFTWRMKVNDLDHSHYCQVLTADMTPAQKCWFSFLFGMTYRTPQAYAYWYTFPDFEKMNLKEVIEWNADNWKRTTYGTDARYNKGHFATQFASIQDWVGSSDLLTKVSDLTMTDDAHINFEQLFAAISRLFKYGRMTAWITCQCLYDTLNLNMDFDNVLIRNPMSDSSMQSIWNGYCMLKGQYTRLLGDQYAESGFKPSDADLLAVSKDIMVYREKAQKYSGLQVDVFKWESIWCQFKRLFNKKGSKEYPGHSSGDATSRYMYYKENWPEVDWTLFRAALISKEVDGISELADSIITGQTYVNDYNKIFGQSGLVMNIHEMFTDMPNAYEVLGLDPNENLVHDLFTDHGLDVPNL